jgi:hypothetical protein
MRPVSSGKDERGHRLTDLGHRIAGAVLSQPLHQAVDCGGEIGGPLPGGIREGAQLLAQGQVEVTHALERLVEALLAGVGDHPVAPGSRRRQQHLAARE